jgi:hypothetical protein
VTTSVVQTHSASDSSSHMRCIPEAGPC